MTTAPERVQPMPLARTPLDADDPATKRRSPVCMFVSVIVAEVMLALLESKTDALTEAIATAAPFSIYVVDQSLDAVSAVFVVVVVVIAPVVTARLSMAMSSAATPVPVPLLYVKVSAPDVVTPAGSAIVTRVIAPVTSFATELTDAGPTAPLEYVHVPTKPAPLAVPAWSVVKVA